MRHRYACPVRWADLDLLGHVNNVVYVDYLQEARVDLFRTHTRREYTRDLVEGVVVARHDVTYLTPISFSFDPVLIECWVTDIRAASFTLAYEVFRETESGRVVHMRASSVLAPYVFETERPRRLAPEEKEQLEQFREPSDVPAEPPRIGRSRRPESGHFPLHPRFSDVDVYGHVNNVKYFEYVQEARILMLHRLWGDRFGNAQGPALVVGRTQVEYLAPALLRAEPYDVWSWVSRVGGRSFSIDTEITDGDRPLARARVSLVFFDPATGRSTQPEERHREALLEAMAEAEAQEASVARSQAAGPVATRRS